MTWTEHEPAEGWVKARHQCAIAEVFLHLRTGIERDVAARAALAVEGMAPHGFTIVDPAGDRRDSFTVLRTGGAGDAHVRVSYTATAIQIGALTATLTLNLQGECRLVVDGQELEGWQVPKLALERLFFQD